MSRSSDPLLLPATLDRLDHLRAAGALDVQHHREAVRFVTATPSPATWVRLLDPAALALGATLIVASVLYLVGWNWFDLPHPARIGLALLPVLVAGGLAIGLGARTLAGQISAITAGALGLVPLLIVGLAFPSTASGELLLTLWALTVLPWAVGARSPFGWLAFAVAAEAALLGLLPRIFPSDFDRAWVLFDGVYALHLGLFGAFVAGTALLAWRGDRSAPPWLPEVFAVVPLLVLSAWVSTMAFGVRQGLWLLRGPALLLFIGLLSLQILFWFGRVRLLPATAHALGLLAVALAVIGRLLVELVKETDFLATFVATTFFGGCGIVGLVLITVGLHLGWQRAHAAAKAP